MTKRKKIYDFKKQLSIGDEGEKLFLELYSHKGARKSDILKFDFYLHCGATVELKTDTYSIKRTKNFFIERWSDFRNKRPGGPFQSEADFFVYLFIKQKVFYWFRRQELLDFLSTKRYGLVAIKNKGYTTMGYKVSRRDVKHLCIGIDKFD